MSGEIGGEYFWRADLNTMVVTERRLDMDDERSGSAALHELGHAYWKALRNRNPAAFSRLLPAWHAEYWKTTSFATPYAATSPQEMWAVDFGSLYDGHRGQVNPTAARLLTEF